MIAVDEAALRCDMLETYRVFDLRALPARQAALFASGLRSGSRIRLKLAGAEIPVETRLMALIADALQLLVWLNTKDGVEGRNRPPSIYAAMTKSEAPEEPEMGFETAEEFEAWRAGMLGG